MYTQHHHDAMNIMMAIMAVWGVGALSMGIYVTIKASINGFKQLKRRFK